MEGLSGSGLVSALPPPRPKSPPEYPDLYGKRRVLAKIQMLEKEIGSLEEELKSADGFQQASRSCKEIVEFVTSNADPLMPTSRTKEIRRPHGFGKWLCGVSCFNISGICTTDPEIPPCSKCGCSGLCVTCRVPKFTCGSCLTTERLNKSKCCWSWCIPKFRSCITCSCSCIKCSASPKCLEVNFCSCYKNCCYPSYFCY
ncbi:guanine nucleotide-binding protein subunit gamma 3-like [Primulina eburnea]|uniref:guanine nucleotide-binding protein subunit gamma 3-like n=1 Tax=Primulina eburnea TaxID=1245227 RepID=UPI003C6C541C